MKRKNEAKETGRIVSARTDAGPNMPAQTIALLPTDFAAPQIAPAKLTRIPSLESLSNEDVMDIDDWENSFGDAFTPAITSVAVPLNRPQLNLSSSFLLGLIPAAAQTIRHTTQQLFEAVISGNVDQIRLCVASGVHVDSIKHDDEQSKTALIVAAMSSDIPNKIQVVKTLLELGANPNAAYYIKHYFNKVRSKFLDNPLLIELCRSKGNLEIIKLIFEHTKHEVKLDAKFINTTHPVSNSGILEAAVKTGDIALIDYLIEKGTKFVKFENNESPSFAQKSNTLNYAIKCNVKSSRIMEVLNDPEGALVQCLNKDLGNFISNSVRNNWIATLDWIWERTPQLDQFKNKKPKVLQQFLIAKLNNAIERIDSKLIDWLAEKVEDINASDIEPQTGNSPLTMAASRGNIDIIEQLVEKYGADVNAFDAKGQSPLIEALKQSNYRSEQEKADIVKYLTSKGANVNVVGLQRETPLMLAIPHKNIIRILIENGADVNAKDINGDTALIKCFDPTGARNFYYRYPSGPISSYIDAAKPILTAGATITKKHLDEVINLNKPENADKIKSIFRDELLLEIADPKSDEVTLSLKPQFIMNYKDEFDKELSTFGAKAAYQIFRGGSGHPEQGINSKIPFANLVADIMPEIFKHLDARSVGAFLCASSQFNHKTLRTINNNPVILIGTPYTLQVAREKIDKKFASTEQSFTVALEASRQATAENAAKGRR